MNAVRRKVLLITFQYPPGHETGTLRPLKFTKYLREFGWEPLVLTVRASCYPSQDDALLADVPPALEIHRSWCVDAKAAFSIAGRYPGFLTVPDRYLSWLPSGLSAALRLLSRHRIDALCSTSPIATAHLIAMLAKAVNGTPWVADFRDPWGADLHGSIRRRVERWLERQVASRADRVVVTTPELGDYIRERCPAAANGKVKVVFNGFDEPDFAGLPQEATPKEPFTILHSGVLYPGFRDPGTFLRALRICLDRSTLPGDAKVVFIGAGELVKTEEFAALVRHLALEDMVSAVPRLAYRECLAATMAAGALLLLQGGDEIRQCIPNKAFEYLRTARPILVLAPPNSATANLMRQFSGTFLAGPMDAAGVAESLEKAFLAWKNSAGATDRMREGLMRFSRREEAAQLAEILDGVVPAGTPAREIGRLPGDVGGDPRP